MKPLRIDRDAKAELAAAREWYDARQPGIGSVLLDEIQLVLDEIRNDPAGGALHPTSGLRYRRTRRFPYAVYYLELDEVVWVAAFAHERRRPGYWRHRRP